MVLVEQAVLGGASGLRVEKWSGVKQAFFGGASRIVWRKQSGLEQVI